MEELIREDAQLLTKPMRVARIINAPRLQGRDGFPVLPIVAAALYRRFDVVDALLPHYGAIGMQFDAFVMTVLSGSKRARQALKEMLGEHPHILRELCPSSAFIGGRQATHPLASSRGPTEDLRLVGCSLLEIAAKLQLTDTVQLLLQLGSTHTLVSALQAGAVEELRRILRQSPAGFNLVNRHFDGRSAAEANIHSMTPLMYAACRNDVAMARMLLEEGADIFVQRRGQSSTCINYAQIYDRNVQQRFPMLLLLLEEYRRRRRAGECPPDWINLRERCNEWMDSTHPDAKNLIVEYELDMDEDDIEGVDEVVSELERHLVASWLEPYSLHMACSDMAMCLVLRGAGEERKRLLWRRRSED
ncbi:hypothetical protein GUITHDRAFT_132424 [Guillardia theta CCMP2712]|uniref:Uncharacterized protein n=1 Tax=Guillardia theta (strain CCMP2712) TaxID=905079 RepID=L1K0M0_GUITC|nr:hypothetical protein GUITHDRAFT_132424 [Guillardia theta CCMP2712]EKX53995.1 hypothetical protein GUITHDRAFT_132424 [Guillardia theta CCMP2712]|mmetsp:Transcript_30800/g.99047  ORF Transcript_30800/g.99047 Transcript_30800/m.99047 type:complete len:361 (-) Transcript_30800:98-1180(-)|eukprot:XP_005840975.1 hypothetical protein GUITHDRAFT_132424 [Guillardia theta CCMP2712]